MDIFDIFEKNVWEVNLTNPLSQEARHDNIKLVMRGDFLLMSNLLDKEPSLKIVLRTKRNKKYSICEITEKLSHIKKNQEKIINVYEYISIFPESDELGDFFYIDSNVAYSQALEDELILFFKIQKYIFESESEIFLPQKFLIDVHNKFCKEPEKINSKKSSYLIDSRTSIPFRYIERNSSNHRSIEILAKMDFML